MNFNTINKVQYNSNCNECRARGTSLFKLIPDKDLSGTQEYRKEQLEIPARTRIFQEGDYHDHVYSMFKGWGFIYKTVSNNGKRQILRFILPGDLIGYQTNTGSTMPYSAGTITESVLCAFPKNKIKPMLQETPELAIRLVDMESRVVSLCQNHLMAAGRKTARESIAFLLLELFYRVRQQIPKDYSESSHSIVFPLTQEDIGDAVGLTNIHVNRVIKEMMREKLIHCHKKNLIISEEEKLSQIAEFKPDMILNSH